MTEESWPVSRDRMPTNGREKEFSAKKPKGLNEALGLTCALLARRGIRLPVITEELVIRADHHGVSTVFKALAVRLHATQE